MTNPVLSEKTTPWEFSAVAGVLLIWAFMLSFHIGPGLIAGLAVFSLTRFIRRALNRVCQVKAASIRHAGLRWIVSMLPIWMTTVIVASLVILISLGFGNVVKFVAQTLLEQGPQLLDEAMTNLFAVVSSLPEAVRQSLPESQSELLDMARNSLGGSMGHLKSVGGAGFFIFIQLMFALILGVSAGLMTSGDNRKPLSAAWLGAMEQYVRCFTLLMGAQVYVSLWNTFCTAVFIYGVLPFFDVLLPFRELLLTFTAVASLIPAAGNIMANTLILMLTLRFGPWVALGSVTYLFVIHKLEYFVNGYFIGRNVSASVPEMLIAIIIGEIAFGLPGLITGPVTYAFLKLHWQRWGWV